MKDNVIWVDFSAKKRRKGPSQGFFSSILSFFKSPTYNSPKQSSKKVLTEAHKTI